MSNSRRITANSRGLRIDNLFTADHTDTYYFQAVDIHTREITRDEAITLVVGDSISYSFVESVRLRQRVNIFTVTNKLPIDNQS